MAALIFGLIALLLVFISDLLGISFSVVEFMFNLDIGKAISMIPVLVPLFTVVYSVAFGLLLLNLITGISRPILSMDPTAESDNPITLIMKAILFGAGIFAYPSIIWGIMTIFNRIHALIRGILNSNPLLNKFDATPIFDQAGAMTQNTDNQSFYKLFAGAILAYAIIGLTVEVAQRYFAYIMTIFLGPLSFAMAPSKFTSKIWQSWVRMLIGNMMTMTITLMIYHMLTSVATRGPKTTEEFIPWILLIFAIVGVAKKIDTYLNQAGVLNAYGSANGMAAIAGATFVMMQAFKGASHYANRIDQKNQNDQRMAMTKQHNSNMQSMMKQVVENTAGFSAGGQPTGGGTSGTRGSGGGSSSKGSSGGGGNKSQGSSGGFHSSGNHSSGGGSSSGSHGTNSSGAGKGNSHRGSAHNSVGHSSTNHYGSSGTSFPQRKPRPPMNKRP